MSGKTISHHLVLASLFAGCVGTEGDEPPVEEASDQDVALLPAGDTSDLAPAQVAAGALVWHQLPPEPRADDEAPARFRLAPSASPDTEHAPAELTRFSQANDRGAGAPIGPDALAAPAPEALASFTASNEFNDRFGYSTAVGDFDNDGLDDLAIGAPFEDYGAESSGLVFLFQGTAAGLVPWAIVDQIGANEAFDRFGWALAAGDFDGDGIDDLAASALNEGPAGDATAGAVFVYRGSATGLADWFYYHQESPALDTNEDRDQFGYALAAGDYNGDGKDDLAVGAPGETRTVREGVVYLLAGGASGMTGMGEVKQGTLGVANDNERFGSALASGDLFGTSADELVVGAYNDVVGDWRAGSIFIYQGSGSGLTPWGRRDQWTVEENDDDFGRALAVGDFDGDGRDDLAVGSPGENHDTGVVFLYRGTGIGLSQWETVARSGGQPGDRFGAALTAGRIDTDALDELVVGSPRAVPSGSSNRAGVANVFFGDATSMIAHSWEMRQSRFVSNSNDPREDFGLALAVGRFRSFLYGDVAVSAPGDGLEGFLRVGSIYAFKGSGSGASFSFLASQKLVQN